MRREDVLDLVKRVPPADLPKLVLVLKSGVGVTVDTVYRLEPDYVVVRGREAGTDDDGRGFFVPYAEVSYVKIERKLQLAELKAMFGPANGPALPAADDAPPGERGSDPAVVPAPSPVGTPPPAAALDPASIAKQNLLDRIRAARTSAAPRR